MPTIENLQRADKLKTFVRQEIEDFRAGKVQALTPYPQLGEQFGYSSRTSVRHTLEYAGLAEERKALATEAKYELIPSEELAWLIGIFSASAGPDRKGAMVLSDESQPLLDTFERRGAETFKLNPVFREPGTVRFNSVDVVNALGDLGIDNWHATLLEEHDWLLKKRVYIWRFLEGFYEKRGSIYERENANEGGRRLTVHCGSAEGANLLAQLMFAVGVNKPIIKKNGDGSIEGVTISNIEGIGFFARNIHSENPETEKNLEAYRNKEPQKGAAEIKYSEQYLMEVWRKITNKLGHVPSYSDIERLKAGGITMVHPDTFGRRFGNRNFDRAKVELVKRSEMVPATNVQRVLDLIRAMDPAELRELSSKTKKLFEI